MFQILGLPHDHNWNIHFPYKKGDLNLHSGIGGSVTANLAHLQFIWEHCIENILNISVKELKVKSYYLYILA